ncbi:DNA-binding HTH domain-containing protein [Eggerthella sp. YY7918]|nr:DNA-binding HTH domain-containing protein [Eggerthella sp. YY7918]
MGAILEIEIQTDAQSLITNTILAATSIALLFVNIKINSDSLLIRTETGKKDIKPVGKDVLLPLVCAMALVLITPIANAAFGVTQDMLVSNNRVVPVAYSFSLILLVVIWFMLKRDLVLPQLYCVLLPIMASFIFLLPLFAPHQAWIILFLGDVGMFFVSILMVTTCLDIAKARNFPVVALYGLFAGCVYFSGVIQLVLESIANNGTFDVGPYATALVLMYVLMIPAFLLIISRRDNKKGRVKPSPHTDGIAIENDTEPNAGGALDIERACAQIAERYHLPKRQRELLDLFAVGRDVTYIAKSLYLSPNTIRSYRKALYATLGVHSRQELIDLIENERKGAGVGQKSESASRCSPINPPSHD